MTITPERLDGLEAVARAATEPESREGQIARYWFDQKFPPEVCLSLIEQVRSSTGEAERLREALTRIDREAVGGGPFKTAHVGQMRLIAIREIARQALNGGLSRG